MLTKFQREVRDALLLLYGHVPATAIVDGVPLDTAELDRCQTCNAPYERTNSRMNWCPLCSIARRKASQKRRNLRYWRNRREAQ